MMYLKSSFGADFACRDARKTKINELAQQAGSSPDRIELVDEIEQS